MNKYHEIKLPGCVIFITTNEMLSLLQLDQDLWQKVLKRGKAFKREKENRQRQEAQLAKFHKTKI